MLPYKTARPPRRMRQCVSGPEQGLHCLAVPLLLGGRSISACLRNTSALNRWPGVCEGAGVVHRPLGWLHTICLVQLCWLLRVAVLQLCSWQCHAGAPRGVSDAEVFAEYCWKQVTRPQCKLQHDPLPHVHISKRLRPIKARPIRRRGTFVVCALVVSGCYGRPPTILSGHYTAPVGPSTTILLLSLLLILSPPFLTEAGLWADSASADAAHVKTCHANRH